MSNSQGKYQAGSAMSQAPRIIMIQVLSSILTFILNTFIARIVGPIIFGIANIEFYVVYSAAQFLSREYVRKAALIYSSDKQTNKRSKREIERNVFNMGWLAVLISFIISILIYLLFGYNKEFNEKEDNQFSSSIYYNGILLCTLSGQIEIFAEPYILIATIRVWEKYKSLIESIGLVLRCVFAFIAIYYFSDINNQNHYLLSFGFSQILASSIVFLLWFLTFIKLSMNPNNKSTKYSDNGFRTFSDLIPSLLFPDYELIQSSFQFFLQCVIKFGLNEGEKIVMIGLNIDTKIQGIYSLVSNLGSLIARYIFAQIERMANSEFSKLDIFINKKIITNILSNILKLVCILSLLCVTFSPNYSYMTLNVIYGSQWSETDAPAALATYCIYLFLMSINGITESFVMSSTPNAYYHIFLISTTFIYWICVGYLMNTVCGLIYANCINMIIRISYNLWFIHYNISLKKVLKIFESIQLFIILIISYFITSKSNDLFVLDHEYKICGGNQLICYGIHSGVAVICLFFIVGVLWKFEKQFVLDAKRLMS